MSVSGFFSCTTRIFLSHKTFTGRCFIEEIPRYSRKKNLFKGHFSGGTKTEKNDAIEALISLGYDEKNIASTVSKIVEINPEATTEELIKKALAVFSGHGGSKA